MSTIIARRSLKLQHGSTSIDVEVRIFAPHFESDHWCCDYEIDWPEGMRKATARGNDSVQALHIALQIVGSELYTSDYHKAGCLSSGNAWKGYGFPVTKNISNLLIGDDAEYF